jgi:hypothetical protein
MNVAIRECVVALLQRLAAMPISDVLNGNSQNPFAVACDSIGRFRELTEFIAFVDGLLERACPDDCEDPKLFHDICETLRRKFHSECDFLLLLEKFRFYDALFQIEFDLFPDISPSHATAIRAQREFAPPPRRTRPMDPPFVSRPVKEPPPDVEKWILSTMAGKEKNSAPD